MENTLEVLSDADLDVVSGGYSYTSIDISVSKFKQVAIASKGGEASNSISVTGVSNTTVFIV